MTPDEKIRRGHAAERLLKDPLLSESFDELRRGYLHQWERTAPDDKDGRECLWLAHRIVGRIQKHLNNVVANGKLEQKELDALAKETEVKRARAGR